MLNRATYIGRFAPLNYITSTYLPTYLPTYLGTTTVSLDEEHSRSSSPITLINGDQYFVRKSFFAEAEQLTKGLLL